MKNNEFEFSVKILQYCSQVEMASLQQRWAARCTKNNVIFRPKNAVLQTSSKMAGKKNISTNFTILHEFLARFIHKLQLHELPRWNIGNSCPLWEMREFRSLPSSKSSNFLFYSLLHVVES